MDSKGATIDFILSANRNVRTAKRFFRKALSSGLLKRRVSSQSIKTLLTRLAFRLSKLFQHYRSDVYGPDWLGFGKTDKVFDFLNMYERRIQHIQKFMEVLCINETHFIGNSIGGVMLVNVASQATPDW